jgi:hypothetical protein
VLNHATIWAIVSRTPLSSNGLGRRVLNAGIGVRFPVAVLKFMKEFLKDTANKILTGSSLILNIGLFLFFYFFIRQSNIPIVLHYNVNWGVDILGEVKSVFILPVAGMFIFLLNSFLAVNLWGKNKTLSYFFTAMTLLVQFFLIISGIALYIINK